MRVHIKRLLALILVAAFFVGAIVFANSLTNNDAVIGVVDQLGYLGVTLIAIAAGLNTFVPLPAGTFVTVFTAAGLWLPLIIFFLALGTLIADGIGFLFGHVSRDLIANKYPKLFAFITEVQTNHHRLIIPVVIVYAALVPFPNEVILIPLALAGIRFRTLLIPLIIGNIIHQIIIIFGVQTILGWFT
jgi:membrane protein YqaA with SNARE-associated domain